MITLVIISKRGDEDLELVGLDLREWEVCSLWYLQIGSQGSVLK